jgi:hypothetical protein
MKHIRATSRHKQMPARAASLNFVALLRFILNVNHQIIDALFKL